MGGKPLIRQERVWSIAGGITIPGPGFQWSKHIYCTCLLVTSWSITIPQFQHSHSCNGILVTMILLLQNAFCHIARASDTPLLVYIICNSSCKVCRSSQSQTAMFDVTESDDRSKSRKALGLNALYIPVAISTLEEEIFSSAQSGNGVAQAHSCIKASCLFPLRVLGTRTQPGFVLSL